MKDAEINKIAGTQYYAHGLVKNLVWFCCNWFVFKTDNKYYMNGK